MGSVRPPPVPAVQQIIKRLLQQQTDTPATVVRK